MSSGLCCLRLLDLGSAVCILSTIRSRQVVFLHGFVMVICESILSMQVGAEPRLPAACRLGAACRQLITRHHWHDGESLIVACPDLPCWPCAVRSSVPPLAPLSRPCADSRHVVWIAPGPIIVWAQYSFLVFVSLSCRDKAGVQMDREFAMSRTLNGLSSTVGILASVRCSRVLQRLPCLPGIAPSVAPAFLCSAPASSMSLSVTPASPHRLLSVVRARPRSTPSYWRLIRSQPTTFPRASWSRTGTLR